MYRTLEMMELLKIDSPLMKPIEITTSSAFMSNKSLYLLGALVIVTIVGWQVYSRIEEKTEKVRPKQKGISVKEFLSKHYRKGE